MLEADGGQSHFGPANDTTLTAQTWIDAVRTNSDPIVVGGDLLELPL